MYGKGWSKDATLLDQFTLMLDSMLELIMPNYSHKDQWGEIITEWGYEMRNPSVLFQDSFENFLSIVVSTRDSNSVEYSLPKSSIYFLKNDTSNHIIWCIWIRHDLHFPHRDAYSTHVGYGIRPSERGKWYATEMLRLGLDIMRSIGITQVLISCHADNIASENVILTNGWMIFGESMDKNQKKLRQYLINTLC